MIKDMDKWTRIRRDVLVEKMSRREACRKYNLSTHKLGEIRIGERKGFLENDLRLKPQVSQVQEGAHAFTEEPVYDYLP